MELALTVTSPSKGLNVSTRSPCPIAGPTSIETRVKREGIPCQSSAQVWYLLYPRLRRVLRYQTLCLAHPSFINDDLFILFLQLYQESKGARERARAKKVVSELGSDSWSLQALTRR